MYKRQELHDGYLDTSFALDPDEDEEQYRYGTPGVTMRTIYAQTPESRAAVDAADVYKRQPKGDWV